MTDARFYDPGTGETFKGAVHAVAVALLGAMALYNLMAWCYRRERRNAINAVLYGLLVCYETYEIWLHWHEDGR